MAIHKIDLGKVQGTAGMNGKDGVVVHNLLDNSDFRKPVNQRGRTDYTGNVYTIDRWCLWSGTTLTVNSGYITVGGTNDLFVQYVEGLDQAKIYSFFVCDTNGVISKINCTFESNGNLPVVIPRGSYIWAALYEGEYTVETCPAYTPKGYGAELAECKRYYQQSWIGAQPALNAAITTTAFAAMRGTHIPFQQEMRIVPTLTFYNSAGTTNQWSDQNANSTYVIPLAETAFISEKGFLFSTASGAMTIGHVYLGHYSASADL